MMKAYIQGLGWVTPAGMGEGRNAGDQPLIPGELEIPSRKAVFAQPYQRFGRLDDFSRLGLAAIAFCLRDAGQEEWQEKRDLGILVASRYGCLQTDLAYLETMLPEQGQLASPNLFAYTLPNCFLGEAALRFGLTGSTMVVNQTGADDLTCLRLAMEELAWSDQQAMLAGCCDLPAPQNLATAGESPGALFLLLGKEPLTTAPSYGELELEGGQLLRQGRQLSGLRSLLTDCLKLV